MSTLRCPNLPLLPGYSFNRNIGRTNFRLNSSFDFFGEGNRALIDKVRPNMFGALSDRFPSIYPPGQSVAIPGWIAYDKQILCFDAFFQETLQEFPSAPYQIRKVKIYYFLEDGTIQVIEPKVENSGISQGTLISRQRIRIPAPMDDNFYEIIDLNIGREIEFYGRVFKITNCDKFTRNFLNRCGISVPDPIHPSNDPYLEVRSHANDTLQPKKPNRNKDTLGKFLENDKKVLCFDAYWDDKETEYGYIHDLKVRYYLADDTMEIQEVQTEAGGEPGFMFLRKGKIPKRYNELPPPGSDSMWTVLNVIGSDFTNKRYIVDPLDCGKTNLEFYEAKDLSIGGIVNCYGRKLVLTDCDKFTKEYYAAKYGISQFTPIKKPRLQRDVIHVAKPKDRELPPWNGFGSFEDSAQNCITVEPKPPERDIKKFLLYDRNGLDSHILNFEAKMKSKIIENCSRNFVISYYLSDDTIAVFEVAKRNSGFTTSKFASRNRIPLPGQEIFTSKPPLYYTPQHMFIGTTIIINGFTFILVNADEYALRFMEINNSQFPKANLNYIMQKVKEKLKPIYKDFVAENIPQESSVISYEKLRSKLCQIMGDDFTEHEMITIARGFSADCYKEKYDKEKIRAIALTELKRYLWDDLVRLREYFIHADDSKSGKLTENQCYTILKGCRLPFDKELLNRILQIFPKDKDCKLSYNEIIQFLDRSICQPPDVIPSNIKADLWWGSEPLPPSGKMIDWCAFNKHLDLESTFKDTVGPNTVQVLENINKNTSE